MIKVINGLLAIIGGVGGAMILFWALNALVERLPRNGRLVSSRGSSSARRSWR